MTKDQAHQLLDAAKRGVNVSEAAITHALWTTGDIAKWARLPKAEPEDLRVWLKTIAEEVSHV